MFHDRVKSPTPLPIVPRNRLVLAAHGAGDDARFARLFRETWLRLPLGDRRKMLDHWRNSRWSGATDAPAPQIELLDGWTEPVLTRSFKPKVSRALGQCSFAGQVLRFHAAVVDRMPDAHVRELVAHELAHVLLMATGDFCRRLVCEIRADRQMSHWGFAAFAMDEWIHQEIKGWTKDGHVLWHEPPRPRAEIQHLLGDWSDGRFHPRYLGSHGQPLQPETWHRAIGTSTDKGMPNARATRPASASGAPSLARALTAWRTRVCAPLERSSGLAASDPTVPTARSPSSDLSRAALDPLR